ncbi:MAG: DUF2331 family protein [Neisseriaceae bacterium]|nr:MAG: DUF2331 family protein [Neisseriaceae bacterium]
MNKKNIWIFSSVIDNFGDAGVAYRIAREISLNKEFKIFLFIDDIITLAKLENSLSLQHQKQIRHNIIIIQWNSSCFSGLATPDIILETFGCFSEKPLNNQKLESIPQINIEYLSAEDWTLNYHLKPSLLGTQKKFFYFLGFNENSGGLFIENNYTQEEMEFKKHDTNILNFVQKYKIPFNLKRKKIFIFGYESNIWHQWTNIWRQLNINYELWIAEKKVLNSMRENRIHTVSLPFVNQTDFDKLLWLSDIAIVRGEDSFIRAQLAGIPFFWHIYPQKNQLHLKKLSAFWCQVTPYYENEIFFHHQRLSLALNEGIVLSDKECYTSWNILLQYQENWLKNTQSWRDFLLSQSTAYEKLTQFIKKQLELPL